MSATRSLVAAFAIALASGACASDGGGTIIVDDPVGDATDEGFARGEALADHAADELAGAPYDIVIGKTATILATLNDGEIDQAAFAVEVVIDDDVFEFANDLIIDHEDLNVELDFVIRGYGIPYLASSAADALAADAGAGMRLLRTTPPADIDFTFVELQVINHAQALVLLDELEVQVGPGPMSDHIEITRELVDIHLEHAQRLLDTYY
jgi:predicted outer membrane protein